MARNSNTVNNAVVAITPEQRRIMIAELAAKYASPAASGEPIMTRLAKWGGDRLADSADNFAELAAGARAAVRNGSVAYATADERQRLRLAEKAIDAAIRANS
jgi:hypothetical protein